MRAGRIDVGAAFEPLEIVAHVVAVPGGISCQLCEIVPVAVMRVDRNHRIVRRASAERARARVENAIRVFDELAIAPLLLFVPVVAYEVVPLEGFILSRRAMKAGDLVVVVLVLA